MRDGHLTYHVIRNPDFLISHAEELKDLAERARWFNPYFTKEWLWTWWKRQSKGSKCVFILARTKEKRLEGFWPFVEKPGLLGTKGLWPFVYDEANYFHPCSTSFAVDSLVEGLESLLDEFLFCWLPLIPDLFWNEYLESLIEKKKFLTFSRSPRKTTLIHPQHDQSFEDFWNQKMGSKSRKSFRYDQRSLEARGEVSFDSFHKFEEIRSNLATACMVEVESRKSIEGVGLFSIKGKRGFFFELLPELGKQDSVRLSILKVGEKPIAWQLDLLGKNCLWIHHLAYDQEWKKFSPGKQLLNHSLADAWKEGRIIDFLPLNFEYKEKISTSVEPVREFHWFCRSLRGRLARRLIMWNIRARSKIRKRKIALESNYNSILERKTSK